MRWMYRTALLVVLLSASALGAAPPTVTAPPKVFGEVGDWVFVKATTDGKGLKVVPLDTGLKLFPSEKLKDPTEMGFYATKPGSYRVLLYTGSAEGPSDPTVITVTFGGSPTPPGPEPPIPEPNPPTPKVESFRVILIYESSATYPAAVGSVLYGRDVEDYLISKCTGGKEGFRRKDKDASTTNDTAVMNELWTAVKASIKPETKIPCAAVEVNGKVTLVNLDATPADMVKTLKKLRGE